MNAILTWLIALLTIVPTRVLILLGFGWLTFQGYKSLVENLTQQIVSQVNSMPAVVYSMASLAGFVDGIGIIIAAITVRAGYVFLDRLARNVQL